MSKRDKVTISEVCTTQGCNICGAVCKSLVRIADGWQCGIGLDACNECLRRHSGVIPEVRGFKDEIAKLKHIIADRDAEVEALNEQFGDYKKAKALEATK